MRGAFFCTVGSASPELEHIMEDETLGDFKDGDFDKSLKELFQELCPEGDSEKFVAEFTKHHLEKLKGMNLETLEEVTKTLIRFLNVKAREENDSNLIANNPNDSINRKYTAKPN